MVLEKTLEHPLDCKEIQPVHPKGDQSWVFIGRTDVEAETPIFGHLMRRADSFGKTLMLGKIEDRRRTGWQRMRWLDGITNSMDIGWTPGAGDGQGGLACCSSQGCKESDTTERLKWLNWWIKFRPLKTTKKKLVLFQSISPSISLIPQRRKIICHNLF